jgi:hypothetical protein
VHKPFLKKKKKNITSNASRDMAQLFWPKVRNASEKSMVEKRSYRERIRPSLLRLEVEAPHFGIVEAGRHGVLGLRMNHHL